MARCPVKEAAEAHTNLVLFSLIHNMSEGSDFSGSEAYRYTQKIRATCERAMAEQLTIYDAAVARAKRKDPTP